MEMQKTRRANACHLAFLVALALVSEACKKEPEKVVPVIYPVTVDALEKVGAGVSEVLAKEGWRTKSYSAEGDPGRFTAVVEAALAQNAPVIVTIGTQVTDIALGPKFRNKRRGIVAAAVFDETLIKSLGGKASALPRSENLAIVSDRAEGAEQALSDLMGAFLRNARTIGVFTNRGEANSVASAETIRRVAVERGLEVKIGSITGPSDVVPATRTLLMQGVDALIIPHDKAAVAQAATIVKTAMGNDTARRVPVFSLDDGTVEKAGVLASVSVDYHAVGTHAGTMAAKVLRGEPISSVATIYPKEVMITVNGDSLSALQLSEPTGLRYPVRVVR